MITNQTKISAIRRRDRRGVAAVEFALVAPLLILSVLGALDVGRFINVAQTVNEASREGARRASRNTVTNVSEVKAAAENYLSNEFGVPGLVATVNVSDSSGVPILNGDLTTIPSGSSVSVQVIFSCDQVRWLVGYPGINGKTLETTTVMRRE